MDSSFITMAALVLVSVDEMPQRSFLSSRPDIAIMERN